MKKLLTLSLIFIMVLILFSTASFADTKKFSLSWAPAWDETHTFTQAGLQMNDKLKELSDGKIEFELFPGGQLGNEREVFESVQLGTIDAAFMSSPVISAFSDVLDGFDMPYICDGDMDLYQEIVNSEIGDRMFEKLRKETGVVGLSYLINPGRDFYLNVPFNSLDDAKGIKVRSMESPVHLATYKALGFTPTPLPYSEVYQSMKTGVVDAFEDVSFAVRIQKRHEVAKHVVISGHLTAAPVFIMSINAWDKLNEEEQAWMKEVGLLAQQITLAISKAKTAETIEFMKEQGLTVTQIDVVKAKELVQPVVDEFCAKSEYVKEVVDYINDYKANN